MKEIFVSYRRSDSSDVTGRIFDRLKARFGEGSLFKDVDSIPLGKDFRNVISEAVGHCRVLLAIIGDDWLVVTNREGTRRIDDPNDYVHIEILSALQRQIPIVPVLVEQVSIPRPEELPQPLQDLAFRNGLPVRADPDFHNDIDRLCKELAEYVSDRKPSDVRRKLWWAASAILVTFLFITIVTAVLRGVAPSSSAPESAPFISVAQPANTPVPIRYWIDELPDVRNQDAAKLFSNALGAWQAVVTTPIRKADSRKQANVIISTALDTQVDAPIGPPISSEAVLTIRFGRDVEWTAQTFEAASCRMLGHILGLEYTDTPGQLMSHFRLIDNDLERLPLTPQPEDVARVRRIWGD